MLSEFLLIEVFDINYINTKVAKELLFMPLKFISLPASHVPQANMGNHTAS
jgi:hypothetical protein